MFTRFAANYLLGRLYIEQIDTEVPVINQKHQETINENLYSDEQTHSVNNPLVMKVDERHFVVHGEESVPTMTLGIPNKLFSDLRVSNPPEMKEVLLAKPDSGLDFLLKEM